MTTSESAVLQHTTDRTDTFDKTSLRATNHGRTVHRDYGAHFFRWSWVSKFIGSEDRLLDVGCGPDQPLLPILGLYANRIPKSVSQVDLNTLKSTRQWLRTYPKSDFTDPAVQDRILEDNGGTFSVAVCFEVVEHMTPERCDLLLTGLHRCLDDDGVLLLSTPVFNGKAAKNHIHEYTIPELDEKLCKNKFSIERRFGTFASYHDVQRGITEVLPQYGLDPDQIKLLYKELREFHSDDVLACYLAPLMPDHARNNVWLLRKA